MEKETEFKDFLKDQKRKNIRKFIVWMIALCFVMLGVIAGMFWLFDEAVGLFFK